jgi:uncharacterized protein
MTSSQRNNHLDRRLSETEALEILKEQDFTGIIQFHCQKVSDISCYLGTLLLPLFPDIDMNILKIGGLLHDIGRKWSSNDDHRELGAKWIKDQGFYQKYADVALRHTRYWEFIPQYQPRTIEEYIVCWADKATKRVFLDKIQTVLIKYLNKNDVSKEKTIKEAFEEAKRYVLHDNDKLSD